MHAFMYVHTYVHACVYVCKYVCTYVRTHGRVYVYMHGMYLCAGGMRVSLEPQILTQLHTDI